MRDDKRELQIRLYRAVDLARVEALERRVEPYRPEDEGEVQAMFERARQVQQNGAQIMNRLMGIN